MTLFIFSQIAVTLFLSILFIQSGFDKVFDFKGNLSYIKSVFEKTFLNPVSSILFVIITILEVAAGLYCLLGTVFYYMYGNPNYAIIGLKLATISILCLFLGQRVAKDYAGAASLVSYFILIVLAMYLFTL